MQKYDTYNPNFKCAQDNNGYGYIDNNIGLITYDEVVHAGGYNGTSNNKYYLYNNGRWTTMSPAGLNGRYVYVWNIMADGTLRDNHDNYDMQYRPVINLKADVTATGTGTSADPYVVQ